VLKDRRTLWMLLVVAALTAPWLDKPVHIDDTFVLHVAKQILETPTDPFHGDIDWFGHFRPVWKATTNPPLVSYWLAPALALGGDGDLWLHLWVWPFYFLAAWGAWSLCRRRLRFPVLGTLLVVTSPAFLVSGNLMRDIPAASLVLAGFAVLMTGVDEGRRGKGLLGGFLLGLAVLAKYSLAVVLLPAAWYVWRRRGLRPTLELAVAGGIPLAFWCVHTWVVYGEPHPWYLLRDRSASDLLWQDKWFSACAILGTCSFVAPWVLGWWVRWRRRWEAVAAVIAATAVAWWAHRFYASDWDWGFEAAVWLGAVGLVAASVAFFRNPRGVEGQFLYSWLILVVLFSVFFVPFNAVRHLIVALVPLVILLVNEADAAPGGRGRPACARAWLWALVVLQGGTALAVQAADYEYAAVYRDFATRFEAEAGRRYGPDRRIWFVGHWGWKHYAQKAGWTMLHRDGPEPSPGDVVIYPVMVHVGDVWSGHEALRRKLLLRESVVYPGRVPLRTMTVDGRAGFYAVVSRRIPYRWRPDLPLEVFRVFEVGPGMGEPGSP